MVGAGWTDPGSLPSAAPVIPIEIDRSRGLAAS